MPTFDLGQAAVNHASYRPRGDAHAIFRARAGVGARPDDEFEVPRAVVRLRRGEERRDEYARRRDAHRVEVQGDGAKVMHRV